MRLYNRATVLAYLFLLSLIFPTDIMVMADDTPTVIEQVLLPEPKIGHFPGENIELATLNLTLDFEDVRIPGANGMDIVVGRKYRHYSGGTQFSIAGFGSNFEFEVPSIEVSEDFPTGNAVPQTGYGCVISEPRFNISFYMPDTTMTTVGYASANDLPTGTLMAFTNNSVFLCEGGSPVVRKPDGVKYIYGKKLDRSTASLEKATYYLTKMEDRFGNAINYIYGADINTPHKVVRLNSISRSDGAQVDFSYVTHPSSYTTISKINYADREISFTYESTDGSTSSIAVDTVTDEEGRVTDFEYYYSPAYLLSIELPTGAKAEYTYQTTNPDLGLVGQVKGKTISGPDMQTRSFSYLYRASSLYEIYHADVIEIESDALNGHIIEKIFTIKNRPAGANYTSDEKALHTVTNGTLKLMQIRHGDSPQQGNQGIMYSLHNTWTPVRLGIVGCTKRTLQASRYKSCARPQLKKQIRKVFNGVGNHDNTFVTNPYAFDRHGFALKTEDSYSHEGGSASRFTQQTYYHDKTNWLIGLPRVTSKSANGTTWTPTFERRYHSHVSTYKSSPLADYDFGRKTKGYTQYNSAGEIQQINYEDSDRIERYLAYKRGHSQEIQLPDFKTSGMVSRYEYVDDFGNVTESKDFRGNSIFYAYDKLNRLTGIDYEGSAWNDEIIAHVDEQNHELTSVGNLRSYRYYDALGRTVVTRTEDTSNPVGTRRHIETQYTKQGLVKYVSFPSNASTSDGTTYQYDALGRKIMESTPDIGNTRHWEYLSGHKVKAIDGLGYETVTSYQSFGTPDYSKPIRIAQMVVPETIGPPICDPICPLGPDITVPAEYIVTVINHDLFDNVSKVMQANQTTNYIYDNFNKLCKVSRPDVGDTAMEYSAIGQMMWSTKGATGPSNTCGSSTTANKVNYIYDKHGGLYWKMYDNNEAFQLFGRDLNGNILGALTIEGSHYEFKTYAYNDRNQPIVEYNFQTYEALRWLYDANGNLSHTVYPDGMIVDYAPNALGQATKVGNFAHTIKYHATGGLSEFTFGNQIKRTIAREKLGRVKDIIDTYGASDRFVHYYNYDSESNLLSLYDAFQPAYDLTQLKYDGVGRLTDIRGIWGQGTVGYDDMGNITELRLGARVNTYHYNPDKTLASISGDVTRSFAYDDKGNVTNNGVRSFVYNDINEMISSGSLQLSYDAFGMRTRKIVGNNTTHFNYAQDGQLYRKTDPTGVTTDYIYLNGNVIAEVETDGPSTSTKYLHTDSLGSVSAESNSAGTIAKRYHYEPFGRTIEAGQDDDPGYTGHMYDDDLDLTYMKARYYDPEVGRFYSNDPTGFKMSNPAMFNRYAYANNNPYKYVDPDGEESYLVSRPLEHWLAGKFANHNFVVSHAEYPGDPNATIHSFGNMGTGVTGPVDRKTKGFSEGTYETDEKAWLGLANVSEKDLAKSATKIIAEDDLVAEAAKGFRRDTWYYPVPELTENQTNSNTAASAVANAAQGSQVALPNNMRASPGQAQVDRTTVIGPNLRGMRFQRTD